MNAIQHPDTWFTMVCEHPHLLVWAKQKSYPHWPAKLYSMNHGSVVVRFFGEHQRAILTTKECLMFSQNNPSCHIGANKEQLEKDEKVGDF